MVKNTIQKTEVNQTKSIAYFAVGRRKRAIARIRFYAGAGDNLINGISSLKYCQTLNQKKVLVVPMKISGLNDQYHWSAKVVGGGIAGQIGAVVHGVSRCIAKMSDTMRTTMSQNGLLLRDPREVERKKIYKVKARKMPQFAKR